MRYLSSYVRCLTAMILLLAACAACTPESITLVQLEVTDSGTYRVAGQEIAKERLMQAIRDKRPASGTFWVHLIAYPKTPPDAVTFAVAKATEAGAKVGMVGNELF